MVTKSKKSGGKKGSKGHVKVGKLRLNKETVSSLTSREQKQIKGGVARRDNDTDPVSRCAGCE